MALELPRLQRETTLVEESRTPTQVFQQWWDTVSKAIEKAINDIVTILVRLGLVEVTANGALELSESAINPDGTIKDNKVLTRSITPNGVTSTSFVQTTTPITLPDTTETEILSLTVVKQEDDSPLEIGCSLRIESSDDIVGTFRLYRDGTLLDEADYTVRGSGSTLKDLIPYSFVDEGIPAASYDYSLKFYRNGGGTTVTASEGCSARPREFLR